ncbi:MAG: class I SAM-dependent methyltransferase [Bacteroidia bacterium]|nr:class I SAM-dependent methyltransferase [Bacteroidia bacterium]
MLSRIIKFLVRNIPRKYLIRFSFLFSKIIVIFYKGNNVFCPICNMNFRKFLPYGNKGEDNRLCPGCLSLERHRLLWLYLRERTDFFYTNMKVLHIAPEQPFLRRFKSLKNLEYITADLESPIADVKLNIKQIPFADNTFDVIICNHVLEHIDNELQALNELYRVLKKGGWAILQVPIDYNREYTYEDSTITSKKEREKIFGQYDHLRIYGQDYPKRLEKAGFTVVNDNFVHTLDKKLLTRYRISVQEIIYLCRKV